MANDDWQDFTDDWDWKSFAQSQGWYTGDTGDWDEAGTHFGIEHGDYDRNLGVPEEAEAFGLFDPGNTDYGTIDWDAVEGDFSDISAFADDVYGEDSLAKWLEEKWDFVDGEDWVKYLDFDIPTEEFDFAARDRAMGEYKAEGAYEAGAKGLGTSAAQGFTSAKKQADTMGGRTGLARSGSITGMYQDQMADLTSGYKTGMQQQAKDRRIAMADTKAAYDKSIYDIKTQVEDDFTESISDAIAAGAVGSEEDIRKYVEKDGTQYYYSEADNTLRYAEDGFDSDGNPVKKGQAKGGWGSSVFGTTDEAGVCVVSTALNNTGAWSDSQRLDAVNWCQDTHHDGSERGKTWIKGYHTWGKFLSKWVKKSEIIRYIVDITTDAFVDLTRRNKPNFLGYLIHYGWINPLSYTIGFSKKNKILGKIITPIVISLYTGLFPLFALVSIPSMIKRTLNERRGK